MATLHLLHTNDLHGELTEYGARWLAELKLSLAPCLLLDSGDAVGVGNVGWHRHGERMHELMNGASYDAGALGNREFHFRPGPQRCKVSLAVFPLLCANLVEPRGYGGVRALATLTLDGLPSVYVFGLLNPMVTAQHWARYISPARFEPPARVVPGLLDGLGPGLKVCLSHLGLERDRELAAACPGVDLMLGGHSHTPLEQPERVGDTYLTQNRPHGGSVTKLALDFDGDRLAAVRSELLPLKLKGS